MKTWTAIVEDFDWPEHTFFGYTGSDNWDAIAGAIRDTVGIRAYYVDFFSHLMCAYHDGEIVFLAGCENGNAGLPTWAVIEIFYQDGERSPDLTAAELYPNRI